MCQVLFEWTLTKQTILFDLCKKKKDLCTSITLLKHSKEIQPERKPFEQAGQFFADRPVFAKN
jgi:hypothetical protein